MNPERLLENLNVPTGPIDAVIDTDAYNEVDDQFAIAYLLRSAEKINTVALYAAPFLNKRAQTPGEGMEKSYEEIQKLLSLMGETRDVFRGSTSYLPDEKTPVLSPAAEDLARRAGDYSPRRPLYVIAIGAITNIASAILLNPAVAENTVVIWLGGHARHYHNTAEFNMRQDYAAARVVMASGVPFVQLPCMGVVSAFTLSGEDLKKWFVGKSPIADYLANNAIAEAECYAKDQPWTRVIWDVTAVAWLQNDGDRFLLHTVLPVRLPQDDGHYGEETDRPMQYIYHVHRDRLVRDLVEKVTK